LKKDLARDQQPATCHLPLRLLTLPAFCLGIAFAVLFFKLYGVMTRPEVPQAVSFVVDQFAPGVKIGARVAETRRSVAGLTYVPHLGFVGLPGIRGSNLPDGGVVSFAQVRLLLDEKTRSEPNPDQDRARIDAVEVVTAEEGAYNRLNTALAQLFRKPPLQGCLLTSESGNYREVYFWVTQSERGGVALITDFRRNPTSRYPGMAMTSVIAFRGVFAGSETLRGKFSDATCSELERRDS